MDWATQDRSLNAFTDVLRVGRASFLAHPVSSDGCQEIGGVETESCFIFDQRRLVLHIDLSFFLLIRFDFRTLCLRRRVY